MFRYFLSVAGPALAVHALGGIPAHADNVSKEAIPITTTSWVSCADEGDHCYPNSDDVVTMRYGEGNNFTYIVAKGLERISCNNFWGDPSKGNTKHCAFTTLNLLDVAPDDSYAHAADQGETFTLPDTGQIYWVRYGTDETWMYTLLSGDGESSMACTNDYFNYNPADGSQKVCQYSEGQPYTLSDGNPLTECATQGQNCTPSVGDVVLIRYGIDDTYNWRFLHSANDSYACNNDTFNPNPIHETKRCYWTSVAPSAIDTVGVWSPVVGCDGRGCPISETVSFGTERSNSWATSETWSTTVTDSIEAGFSVEGTGTKVSEQVAVGFATSDSYQTALSQSVTQSYTATCDPDGAANRRVLYQFITQTLESCLENTECTGSTYTVNYACISDPPAGYSGPECVPGYCMADDPLCQMPCAE